MNKHHVLPSAVTALLLLLTACLPSGLAVSGKGIAKSSGGVAQVASGEAIPVLHGLPPSIPKTVKDKEKVRFYDYTGLKCGTLATDRVQEASYPYYKRFTEFAKATDNNEIKIGRLLEEKMREQFKGRLDVDVDWVIYVRKLGARLAKLVNRKNVEYHFHVIKDDKVNAFSIPWGGVYIYTGLLEKIKNEAQLAAIISHEIQHIDLGHCMSVYQLMFKIPEPLQSSVTSYIAVAAAKFIKHPFNSSNESEADVKALETVYSLGYSPYQYVDFWENNVSDDHQNVGKISEWLQSNKTTQLLLEEFNNFISRHPLVEKRSCLLKRHMASLQRWYPVDYLYVGEWNLKNKTPMFEKMI